MQRNILLLLLLLSLEGEAQELFVFSEPASSLPARSLTLRVSGHYISFDKVYNRPGYRLMTEIGGGIIKNLTATFGASLSDMHTFKTKREAFFGEVKYRFLSRDDVQRHFRMAAFVQAGYTTAPFHYDETAVTGDKTGLRLGLIGTQLLNRFAVSATVSHTQIVDASRTNEVVYVPRRIYQAMNYSLSSGYLVLPKQYNSYKQVSLNLYGELLAQQALDHKSFYIDAAPALQFVFFSNTKLNVGYRFQLAGHAQRMSDVSWLFGLERSFLEVWKRRR